MKFLHISHRMFNYNITADTRRAQFAPLPKSSLNYATIWILIECCMQWRRSLLIANSGKCITCRFRPRIPGRSNPSYSQYPPPPLLFFSGFGIYCECYSIYQATSSSYNNNCTTIIASTAPTIIPTTITQTTTINYYNTNNSNKNN